MNESVGEVHATECCYPLLYNSFTFWDHLSIKTPETIKKGKSAQSRKEGMVMSFTTDIFGKAWP